MRQMSRATVYFLVASFSINMRALVLLLISSEVFVLLDLCLKFVCIRM